MEPKDLVETEDILGLVRGETAELGDETEEFLHVVTVVVLVLWSHWIWQARGNVRGHGANLLLNSGPVMEGLLDVGRAVRLDSDVDGVGGSARERLLESDEELAGRRRGHRARHVDMCVCG